MTIRRMPTDYERQKHRDRRRSNEWLVWVVLLGCIGLMVFAI